MWRCKRPPKFVGSEPRLLIGLKLDEHIADAWVETEERAALQVVERQGVLVSDRDQRGIVLHDRKLNGWIRKPEFAGERAHVGQAGAFRDVWLRSGFEGRPDPRDQGAKPAVHGGVSDSREDHVVEASTYFADEPLKIVDVGRLVGRQFRFRR